MSLPLAILHRPLRIMIRSNSSRALSVNVRNASGNCHKELYFSFYRKRWRTGFSLSIVINLRLTVVKANVYLPISLRDTLTANSFFLKGRQGRTWGVSLPAAFWDGDDWQNMAEHCQAQWAVSFSLKWRANMSQQWEQFSTFRKLRTLKRLHFPWLLGFPRRFSQMWVCVLLKYKCWG